MDAVLEVVAEKKVVFDMKYRVRAKADGKVWPIVVKLSDEKDKEMIIQGSSRLKNHQDFKAMYVKQDLTKLQRSFMVRQEEELCAEAAQKNSLLTNGENWEWQIRGRGLMRHLAKIYNC